MTSGTEFPGIYAVNLLDSCWCDDGIRVVVNTLWRTMDASVVINTETSSVTRLPSGMLVFTKFFNSKMPFIGKHYFDILES